MKNEDQAIDDKLVKRKVENREDGRRNSIFEKYNDEF